MNAKHHLKTLFANEKVEGGIVGFPFAYLVCSGWAGLAVNLFLALPSSSSAFSLPSSLHPTSLYFTLFLTQNPLKGAISSSNTNTVSFLSLHFFSLFICFFPQVAFLALGFSDLSHVWVDPSLLVPPPPPFFFFFFSGSLSVCLYFLLFFQTWNGIWSFVFSLSLSLSIYFSLLCVHLRFFFLGLFWFMLWVFFLVETRVLVLMLDGEKWVGLI